MKFTLVSVTVGALEDGPVEVSTTDTKWEKGSYWKAKGYPGEFQTPGQAINNALRARGVISGVPFDDIGFTGQVGQ